MKRLAYSPEEVATALGRHPDVIRRLCRNGMIPATNRLGRWLIPAVELDRLLTPNPARDEPTAGVGAGVPKQQRVKKRALSISSGA